MRGPLVALEGIDGAGKTSLAQHLAHGERLGGGTYFKKDTRDNMERLARLKPLEAARPESQIRGGFARELRWAAVLDHLTYVYRAVVPRLGEPGPKILDRWYHGGLAWSVFVEGLSGSSETLLQCVPEPDVVIRLEVDPATALSRIARRGAVKEDEFFELLDVYARSYDIAFAGSVLPLIRKENVDYDETVRFVESALPRALDGMPAVRPVPRALWRRPGAARRAPPDGKRPDGGFAGRRRARLIALHGLDAAQTSAAADVMRRAWRGPVVVLDPARDDHARVTATALGAGYVDLSEVPQAAAECLAWARAFDLLKFYEDAVRPRLEDDVLLVWRDGPSWLAEAAEPQIGAELKALFAPLPAADAILRPRDDVEGCLAALRQAAPV